MKLFMPCQSDYFYVPLKQPVRHQTPSTIGHKLSRPTNFGGPGGNFFLDKLSLYLEFQLPMCLGTGLKVCVGWWWVVVVGSGWWVVLKPNLVFRFRLSLSFSLA
jgi:hypothetical protein